MSEQNWVQIDLWKVINKEWKKTTDLESGLCMQQNQDSYEIVINEENPPQALWASGNIMGIYA